MKEQLEKLEKLLSKCWGFPPIVAEIRYIDRYDNVTIEKIGAVDETHCPNCGELWSGHMFSNSKDK